MPDTEPNAGILIALGPRALLALVGAATLVAGVWHTDRTWDEQGSKAYERAAKKAGSDKNVVVPASELDAAFPFPWAFLLGWLIFASSYLFPVSGAFALDLTLPGAVAAIFSLALSVIASVPMGDAVRHRKAGKKKALGLSFVASWVGLTVASGFASGATAVAFVLCALGAVSIIVSMNVLWKFRKMGDTWEQEGRPNPHPIVYNMGGPLFVFGWFLFIAGMAGTAPAHACTSSDVCLGAALPIYFNLRSAMAFFAGCGMVPVVMMLDYAHDEGAEYVGFGTDGKFFGRFWETPLPFLIFWSIFGLASFVNLHNELEPGTRQWLIFVNCVLQGIDAGVLIQTALYEGDMARKNKWSIPFVILFLLLAINLGISADFYALALSLPGAVLVIAGQKTVFQDRRRGDYFMLNHEPNPNPIVYSAGEPLFMLGWILLSLAMSLPM